MLPALNLQLGMDVGMKLQRTAYEPSSEWSSPEARARRIASKVQELNARFSDPKQQDVLLYTVIYSSKFRSYMYVGPIMENKERTYSFFFEDGTKGNTFTTDEPGILILGAVTGGKPYKFQDQDQYFSLEAAGKPDLPMINWKETIDYAGKLNDMLLSSSNRHVQLYRVFYGTGFRAFLYVDSANRMDDNWKEYAFIDESGKKETTFSTNNPGKEIIEEVTGGDAKRFSPELFHIFQAERPQPQPQF